MPICLHVSSVCKEFFITASNTVVKISGKKSAICKCLTGLKYLIFLASLEPVALHYYGLVIDLINHCQAYPKFLPTFAHLFYQEKVIFHSCCWVILFKSHAKLFDRVLLDFVRLLLPQMSCAEVIQNILFDAG